MSTLDRLLGALTRVYDTSPGQFLALRLSYLNGQMQWTIANDTLTTTVTGGMGVSLSIDLSQYTLSTLAVYLASQPGYVVLFLDDDTAGDISALALVPGSGDLVTSNGDHLYAASNLNWLLMAALGSELSIAQDAIEALPAEMATTTADGEWLDLLGSYYAVPRLLGEQDANYSPRIPAEVILPRQNNFAISAALIASTGQNATCTDAPTFGSPFPNFDGAIQFVGSPYFYNAQAKTVYNLFDISIGYDILGSLSPIDFQTAIRQQVDRLRAAGTHLRNLTLTSSIMGDVFTPPTENFVESIFTGGMVGLGSSADSTFTATLDQATTGLSFSVDAGIAALSTAIILAGTGSSFDAASNGLGAATGSSSDAGLAVLTGGQPSILVGTSTSISLSFGDIGPQVIFHGTTSSYDSATGPNVDGGFSLGFSAGFDVSILGTGAPLRTGAGFATNSGTSNSQDDGSLTSLSTGIPIAGTAASADAGSLNSAKLGTGIASGTDSASGSLTAKIKLIGLSQSSEGANVPGFFSSAFSRAFNIVIPGSGPGALLSTGNLKANAIVRGSGGGSFGDTNGDIWTISAGVALKNGTAPAFSTGVIVLALFDGEVWQLTSATQWYGWNGSTWVAHNQFSGWPLSVDTATGILH